MKNALSTMLRLVVEPAFYAIGYFFGFSLIVVLSLGTISSGPFADLFRRPPRKIWHVFFRRYGRWFVEADLTVLVGWAFLMFVAWVWHLYL